MITKKVQHNPSEKWEMLGFFLRSGNTTHTKIHKPHSSYLKNFSISLLGIMVGYLIIFLNEYRDYQRVYIVYRLAQSSSLLHGKHQV